MCYQLEVYKFNTQILPINNDWLQAMFKLYFPMGFLAAVHTQNYIICKFLFLFTEFIWENIETLKPILHEIIQLLMKVLNLIRKVHRHWNTLFIHSTYHSSTTINLYFWFYSICILSVYSKCGEVLLLTFIPLEREIINNLLMPAIFFNKCVILDWNR